MRTEFSYHPSSNEPNNSNNTGAEKQDRRRDRDPGNTDIGQLDLAVVIDEVPVNEFKPGDYIDTGVFKAHTEVQPVVPFRAR